MKKALMVLAVITTAAFVFSCGSAPAAPASTGPDPLDWFWNPNVPEDSIYGFGSSSAKDPATAMAQAEQRARVSIANVLKSTVEAMVIDYQREAGNGTDQSSLNFFESISRSVTSANLSGATRVKGQNVNGTFYVIISIKKADAAKAALATAPDSEAAQYAEFKASNALAALDAKLAETSGKGGAVEK